MKILGLDTSSRFFCLGLYDDGRIYEYQIELGRSLSCLLVPQIKRILDTLGWQLNEIDYFTCGLGPGSFTGIRVGLSTIKGFAWSLNKPIVGICSLDILARNVKSLDGYISPIIDAKRNLLYTAIYKVKNRLFKKISPYMLLTLDEFYKKIKGKTIILGDALGLYKKDILQHLKGIDLLDSDYWYIKPRNIIEVAFEKIKNKDFESALEIKPIYLYPKECQVKKNSI